MGVTVLGIQHRVALRKESVDRNLWWGVRKAVGSVALRKESVDRNSSPRCGWCLSCWSLSARRAWIEIKEAPPHKTHKSVALRKESVDRNFDAVQIVIVVMGRSPQGERG